MDEECRFRVTTSPAGDSVCVQSSADGRVQTLFVTVEAWREFMEFVRAGGLDRLPADGRFIPGTTR